MGESGESFLQLQRLEQQLASARQAASRIESLVGQFDDFGERLAQIVSLYQDSPILMRQHERSFCSLLEDAREKLAALERRGEEAIEHFGQTSEEKVTAFERNSARLIALVQGTATRLEREHQERWRLVQTFSEELTTRVQDLERNWQELVRHYGESLSSIKADIAQLREYLTTLEGRVGQLEAVDERLASRLERTERGLRSALLGAGAGIGIGSIGIVIGCLAMMLLLGRAVARKRRVSPSFVQCADCPMPDQHVSTRHGISTAV